MASSKKTAFSSGQMILTATPVVTSLHGRHHPHRCCRCFGIKSLVSVPVSESAPDGKRPFEVRCCDDRTYCSEKCRDEDMADGHDVDCGVGIRQMIETKTNDPLVKKESDYNKFGDQDEYVTHTEILVRLVIRLIRDPELRTRPFQLPDGRTVCFDDIETPDCRRLHPVFDTDSDRIDDCSWMNEVDYNFVCWRNIVKSILDAEPIRTRLGEVSQELMEKAYRTIVRYTVYITDESYMVELGKGLYLPVCFMPHSCTPNTGPQFVDGLTMKLRYLAEGPADFGQLTFDYQMEMAGFSPEELHEQLVMRNWQCKCKRCQKLKEEEIKERNRLRGKIVEEEKNDEEEEGLYDDDVYKTLMHANVGFANWPLEDYAKYIWQHVNNALVWYRYHYGKYHPWCSGLLLWRLAVELETIRDHILLNVKPDDCRITMQQCKDGLSVTHGDQHPWIKHIDETKKLLDAEKLDEMVEYYDKNVFKLQVMTRRFF